MKKYLEDNYQHRTDLISPIPELKTNGDVPAESKKYQGTGPKTKEGKGWFFITKYWVKIWDLEILELMKSMYVGQKLK